MMKSNDFAPTVSHPDLMKNYFFQLENTFHMREYKKSGSQAQTKDCVSLFIIST